MTVAAGRPLEISLGELVDCTAFSGAAPEIEACTVVFFGATGDLMRRMLFPAITSIARSSAAPGTLQIVGFAKADKSDDDFRADMRRALEEHPPSNAVVAAEWPEIARTLRYVQGDFEDPAAYERLRAVLDANDEDRGTSGNRLFYLSTPPQLFAPIVRRLQAAGLSPTTNSRGWTRLLVEKPFGTDLVSARSLQGELQAVFDERSVYRIDHYLGKESVQDILALRFANLLFEPVWNHRYVESVQITAAETVGVELRGGYYDHSGALRDMIQNHVLNLLALVAMEPPTSASPESIRDEKTKALSAIRPIDDEDVWKYSARGQYGAGTLDGKPVPGYRQEPAVDPASNTETYAAVRLLVDNWRWAGTPFYLRSGKRMRRKYSEIAVRFKTLPHRLFGEQTDDIDQNEIVIKVQPDEGITLKFSAKVPGPKMHLRSVNMDFGYPTAFGADRSPPAYERLIADALRGDATLFTRWDAVEAAWEVVMPILDRWSAEKDASFPNYAAGTQGPQSASELLRMDGARWREA